ncbi:CaiB/BaiF CoA transferase family protein [Algimonas porphyrae]|uniref:CoA transferase n=1 Tax=Algimonas porphyrae TaxID=1128113 RepID=A0ABQ5V394_9PROT|nr:CaiB/BaiF CoA-transferase family protein [Algimonas porphyrae]GLQ21522.1 CoA transferase [Algimonas porphyrae]
MASPPSAPLSGYRIVELAGIGPCPYAGMLLADMGAEVILVNRPGFAVPTVHDRGKTSIAIDLRQPDGVAVLLDLVERSDALIEGLRPGVVERLGIGPDACHARNAKLVYGRMTGWGQTGPWAKTAGHDLNYIAITGALAAMGREGEPPPPPLNIIGDYGGGTLFLVMGVLAALLQAERTGRGDVIDAAMIDGTNSLMGLFHTLAGLGQWTPERDTNLLDGGMPFYRCYATSDGKFMAVGCIEPQFFAEFLRLLEIDPGDFGDQMDKREHAKQHARLEALFKTHTRDHWAARFDGSDACVTPVLDYTEAPDHPQNRARGGLERHGHYVHPRPAPVFGGHYDVPDPVLPVINGGRDAVTRLLGYNADRVSTLIQTKILSE